MDLFGWLKGKREVPEAPKPLLERLLALETTIRAIELQLDEQHDFIRRLASRRAKEDQVERIRTSGLRQPDPADLLPEAEDKAALRRRGLSLLRSGLRRPNNEP